MGSLTETDRELFWLAAEINNCADAARSLVTGETDHAPADLEAAKAIEARRLRRMYRAWFGFRDESEAPYRDARMLLVTCVLAQATIVRRQRAPGTPARAPADEKVALDASVSLVCRIVGALYPSLASQMSQPEREAKIGAAIESAASTEKRTAWVAIAAVWEGIEKGAPHPECWRKDWYDHQQSHRP
jgi:hypothetical protein